MSPIYRIDVCPIFLDCMQQLCNRSNVAATHRTKWPSGKRIDHDRCIHDIAHKKCRIKCFHFNCQDTQLLQLGHRVVANVQFSTWSIFESPKSRESPALQEILLDVAAHDASLPRAQCIFLKSSRAAEGIAQGIRLAMDSSPLGITRDTAMLLLCMGFPVVMWLVQKVERTRVKA